MIKYCFLLAIFLLVVSMLLAQETLESNALLIKAEENHRLIQIDPEKAFQESNNIINKAQKLNNYDAELRAIVTQCIYYRRKNDFENMIITAKRLIQRAKSVKKPVYQAIAHTLLFEAYSFNGLYERALSELEKGSQIIKHANPEDSLVISTKSILFVSYANYYYFQNDFINDLKYIRLSMKENEKFSNHAYKEKLRYTDYANLAGVFLNLSNLDSAEFYAELSISKDKGYNKDDIQFFNFLILGRSAMEKKDDEKAVLFFKRAENIKGYKIHLHIQELFGYMIETYSRLGQEEKVKEYKAKRDSLKLSISENQNKSLQNLLNERDNLTEYRYLYFVFAILLVLVAFFLILVKRKNKKLAQQEKITQDYLDKYSESNKGEQYSMLLEMLKKNDPAFMPYFNEVFPDFSEKLLELNPKLNQSDIDFCALLKLKVATKEIARYKFIEPKTVRNKRYLIKKKFNLPEQVDIYQWFDNI